MACEPTQKTGVAARHRQIVPTIVIISGKVSGNGTVGGQIEDPGATTWVAIGDGVSRRRIFRIMQGEHEGDGLGINDGLYFDLVAIRRDISGEAPLKTIRPVTSLVVKAALAD